MPFTSNCDIYVAIQDAGINRVITQLMEQRPSLFNYGTALIIQNPSLQCVPIDAAPEVSIAGNPLFTVMDPLPVIGTTYGMNFCVQLGKGEIDFYPSNIFALPSDLNPPLPAQQLALHILVCGGIGCASRRIVRPLPSGVFRGSQNLAKAYGTTTFPEARSPTQSVQGGNSLSSLIGNTGQTVTPLPTSELECFCLDLYATGGCTVVGTVGNQRLLPSVEGIDIAELAPLGLEKDIECYALVALNDGILPSVGNSISTLIFGLISLPGGLGDIQISASTAVPNNPAIVDNQLKVFIDVDQIDINITTDGGGGGGGSGSVTRTVRPRTRTGTFDLTAAVSSTALEKIFTAFMQGFKFVKSGSGSFGPFSVNYGVAAHLESGSLELTSTGALEMKDVVVRWDKLYLEIGFNIPSVCTPSFCLIPVPFDGCAVEVPSECLFTGNPDFSVGIDLGGFIDSKATLTAIPKIFYGVGSGGASNQWQIAAMPTIPIYIEFVDIADTATDLFQDVIVNAIDSLISPLPGWAQDLINAVLGGVEDIIRTVLGIPDDIGEWLVDVISSVGIFQDLVDAITQYLTLTLFELDDPYPILPTDGILIPVELPIQFLGLTVNTNEMIIQGDLGD